MRILVTGQCTVHWGRLEFGNIGNYYITESTFRELHRVFPEAEILTTFQLTDGFCQRERVTCLPLELFYSWSENDLDLAFQELGIADIYDATGHLVRNTPFIEAVLSSDLVMDFSGEMWGDHAEPVGKNRFLVGLIKDRVAQLLKRPVILLAGSQGPFSDNKVKEFAKVVFAGFHYVPNREPASVELLKENGFDVSRVRSFADPGFLFQARPDAEMGEILARERIIDKNKPTVGFILCGFNMAEGPYDKWPRKDEEYLPFAEAIEFIVNGCGARVVLMSHQNGFQLHPDFELLNGRDYPIVKQLQNVVLSRANVGRDEVLCIDRPYLPKETKAIIGKFDMFVTGRVHGLVASLSQNVPSVLINRGHGPVSHRNIGFAKSVGVEEYIANPGSAEDLKAKIRKCWDNRIEVKSFLERRIPDVKNAARMAFSSIPDVLVNGMENCRQ